MRASPGEVAPPVTRSVDALPKPSGPRRQGTTATGTGAAPRSRSCAPTCARSDGASAPTCARSDGASAPTGTWRRRDCARRGSGASAARSSPMGRQPRISSARPASDLAAHAQESGRPPPQVGAHHIWPLDQGVEHLAGSGHEGGGAPGAQRTGDIPGGRPCGSYRWAWAGGPRTGPPSPASTSSAARSSRWRVSWGLSCSAVCHLALHLAPSHGQNILIVGRTAYRARRGRNRWPRPPSQRPCVGVSRIVTG
jgi:hypothetical protein